MFKKEIPIIFVSLSVVVAGLVLGWVVFMKQEPSVSVKPPVNNNNQNNEDDEVINDNNDSEIDASNWKSYRNEEYGFEIKYPEHWKLINLGDFYAGNTGVVLQSPNYEPIKDGNVMHKGEIYIRGMDNKNNLSIEELFSTFNDTSVSWFDKFDHTDIVVNRNNEVLFDYIMENSPPPIPQSNIKRIEAYIQGDKKVISIGYLFLENPNREIFDEILYSFKFIEFTDTLISNWKTYRNEEFGFEIKHPENWGASTGEPKPWHKDVLGKVYVTGHSIEDPYYAPIAITILNNEKRLSIKKWYQEYYPNGDVSRLQEVKFDKTNGMRKLSLWNDGLDGFYFSNENRIYSVSIMDLQKNAENQIIMNEKLLSTFEFIE